MLNKIRTWKELSDSFDNTVKECDALIARIEANLSKKHINKSKCSDCATTENLTPYTVAGKHKHICRACLADCRAEGEI
jgi:hypothetical protein